jgi:hypothetical protein
LNRNPYEQTFALASDGTGAPDVRSCIDRANIEGGRVSEPQDIEETPGATLSDEEIETHRLGGMPRAASAADDGDDSGDTGDDTGDPSDTSDTGDDSGDPTDTGDDSGANA